MIICALTGSPREIFLIIFLILVSIFWIVYARRFSKAIDEDFDSLLDPMENLPDEITIEIVKEEPQKPSSVQTKSSDPPSKAED